MIPGLLQTEAYARTLFRNQLPPLCDQQIADQLAARLERQKLLRERPNTAYSFILEEHLFLRRTGGAQITQELIEHILDLAELRNIEIQVMPQVREDHAGLHGRSACSKRRTTGGSGTAKARRADSSSLTRK